MQGMSVFFTILWSFSILIAGAPSISVDDGDEKQGVQNYDQADRTMAGVSGENKRCGVDAKIGWV